MLKVFKDIRSEWMGERACVKIFTENQKDHRHKLAMVSGNFSHKRYAKWMLQASPFDMCRNHAHIGF